MQQYFYDRPLSIDAQIELDAEIAHHQMTVLRHKDGELFRMADSDGKIFLAKLILQKNQAFAHILSPLDESNEMRVRVTVIQALIKGDRWDYFLQKATECGVNTIVPYLSERNVVKYDPKDAGKKLERWRKIVKEAAEQCRRNKVPVITEPIDQQGLKTYKSQTNFVAYEDESHGVQLKEIDLSTDSVSIVIGSEGGFSKHEIQTLTDLGFSSVGLGKRILRAETAAIVALTLIESKT